jgi:hypothetical protein
MQYLWPKKNLNVLFVAACNFSHLEDSPIESSISWSKIISDI